MWNTCAHSENWIFGMSICLPPPLVKTLGVESLQAFMSDHISHSLPQLIAEEIMSVHLTSFGKDLGWRLAPISCHGLPPLRMCFLFADFRHYFDYRMCPGSPPQESPNLAVVLGSVNSNHVVPISGQTIAAQNPQRWCFQKKK